MRVTSLSLRDFRSYEQVRLELGAGLTVIAGGNGAGKTNLLEGLYFGCTGRSCRTNNEREVVRWGASAARSVVSCEDEDGGHEVAVGFAPGEPKRLRLDGAAVERLTDAPGRPLVSVFLPDRLELVKGPPALRRAHLDQFVAALWPARTAARRAYGQALAQRNALIGRVRAGYSSSSSMASWDLELGRHAVQLMADRDAALAAVAQPTSRLAGVLGLAGDLQISYRRRSSAADAAAFAAELAERLEQDLARGFCTHGPHRDEVTMRLDGRELRAYGSQGQQRLALLALLLAEREAIADRRAGAPLVLLDDVMSELDASRRRALVDYLRSAPGQALITTTEPEHVPGAEGDDIRVLTVAGGELREGALAPG